MFEGTGRSIWTARRPRGWPRRRRCWRRWRRIPCRRAVRPRAGRRRRWRWNRPGGSSTPRELAWLARAGSSRRAPRSSSANAARRGSRTRRSCHGRSLPRGCDTRGKVTGSQLPEVGDALRRGQHRVRPCPGARRRGQPAATSTGWPASPAELCDAAQLASFSRWQAEVRGLADLLDADGGHDPAGTCPSPACRCAPRRRRHHAVAASCPATARYIAESALDQIADELFRRTPVTPTSPASAVPRRSQLLAEAFVELCRRGLAVDIGGSRAASGRGHRGDQRGRARRGVRHQRRTRAPTRRCCCATRCCGRS